MRVVEVELIKMKLVTPEKSQALGTCKVLGQISVMSVDIERAGNGAHAGI